MVPTLAPWQCHTCRYAGNDKCWWGDWRCAALAHNSFLHHYWQNSLSAYDFGLYDFSYPDYERWWVAHETHMLASCWGYQ